MQKKVGCVGRGGGSGVDMNKELKLLLKLQNQRTNGPLNAHLISWPSKAQNLENIW